MTSTESKYSFSYPAPLAYYQKIDLGHTIIYQRNDGITEIHCSDDFTYDLHHIQANHQALKRIADEKKLIKLTIAGRFTSVTSEFREYMAQGFHRYYIEAECFLIHSLAQRLIAQFYVKVHRPKIPVQYFSFSEKEKAEKWLREFL